MRKVGGIVLDRPPAGWVFNVFRSISFFCRNAWYIKEEMVFEWCLMDWRPSLGWFLPPCWRAAPLGAVLGISLGRRSDVSHESFEWDVRGGA